MDENGQMEWSVSMGGVVTGRGSGRRHDLSETTKAAIAERGARIRVMGNTWKETHAKILKEFPEANVSEASIIKWVNAYIKPALEESVEQYRQQQLQEIALAKKAIMPKVEKGDIGAIATLARLHDRTAKLLGMDAPVQVQVETRKVDDELEVQKMLAGFTGHVIQGEVVKPKGVESGE